MAEFTVRKNLGPTDRIVRAVIAIYLMITGLSMAALPVWGHLLLLALGIGFLLEAVTGY